MLFEALAIEFAGEALALGLFFLAFGLGAAEGGAVFDSAALVLSAPLGLAKAV